jgi:uncharacterized membrane protein YdjX (TVP38/TMEM64 family)
VLSDSSPDRRGGSNGPDPDPADSGASRRGWLPRALLLLLVSSAFIVIYVLYGEQLTLANLVEQEARLREFYDRNPLLVYLLAFCIYVIVTGLSLPGATVMTLAYGWFFGFWRTLLLVSFASTLGATLAFLLSRYLFRDYIQRRFGDRIEAVNEELRRDGAFYLFTLRLIPAVPFFVINVVMGLTPIRTWTFWWVSQLGMLAGTVVFVFAGASAPSGAELVEQGVGGILKWEIAVALVLLGIFPLAVRKIMSRVKARRQGPSQSASRNA